MDTDNPKDNLCPECKKPVAFSPQQWTGIRNSITNQPEQRASGKVDGECGHVWQWAGYKEGEQFYIALRPYYESKKREKSTYYRDDMDLEMAKAAQGKPDSKTRRVFMDALEMYQDRFNNALEVGCNIGTVAKLVSERFDVGVDGFDFNSPSILEAAQSNPSGIFTVWDADDTPWPYSPGDYDLIYSVGTLMHMGPNLYKKVCAEILRLEPKLIIHQEIQGDIENVIEYREDTPYFMRVHDYVQTYRDLGCKNVTHHEDMKSIAMNPRKIISGGGFDKEITHIAARLTIVVVEV